MPKHSPTKHNLFNLTTINSYTACLVFAAAILILLKAFLMQMEFETAIEVVLGLILGYFIFHAVILHTERHNLIETTNDNFRNLVEHVGVMTIIKTPQEYYQKLKSSIENAQDSVRLLYLTKSPPTSIGKYSQTYWEWFQYYIAKKSNSVVVRRIASLDSKEKIEWVIDKTLELSQTLNYGIRVYNPKDFLPLMGMEIIDNNEVFLFGPHGKTPRWIYINNPDVAEGMAQYFEELWSMLPEGEIKAVGAIATSDSIEQCIAKCLK